MQKESRSSREVYTDILQRGLLAIRGADDLKFARAVANHLYNLPHLLQRLEHAGLHDYYWRVERASFLQLVTPEQARVFRVSGASWRQLERSRRRLYESAV